MPIEGFSPEDCLDFDFSVVDFWEWIEARQAERKPVPESSADRLPNKGKGWTWGPRYDSMNEIFELFTSGSDPYGMDPEVAAIDVTASLAAWASETRVAAWEE
jgi:hypothetical protein